MSELLSTIKKEQLIARKNKNAVRASLLTTLIGEASPSGNDTVTDESVMKVVEKFYKNLCDNRKIYVERGASTEQVDAEIEILLEFLPKQLSESEIDAIARDVIEKNGIDSLKGIGQVMGYFAKHHKGTYNGKVVKDIVTNRLKD